MTTQMHRAFGAFEIKSLDSTRRTFKGVATTPALDRVSDRILPLGVEYKNPLPLLWQHRHDEPIGEARFDPPTARGITFEAEIASADEPPSLRDRLDRAWGEIRTGLVRAVSVGFRAHSAQRNADGGLDYDHVEVIELSIVTIPANAEAVIQRTFAAGGPLPADVVRLVAKASQPGIALVRVARPRFYTP